MLSALAAKGKQKQERKEIGGVMTTAAQQILSAVKALGMPYEVITIDPAYADTAAFCEHYGYPLEHSCNTIIVASKKEPKKFAACVILATTQLDVNRRVRTLLGVSKASFATAEEMMALTGMEVGGVTPFALPADLPLYVDERIMGLEWIMLGGGGRESKIKIAPEVFTKLGATIIADLGLERLPSRDG
jgi:prolyl-tRNA editing enzyme YbaK/EbsC (Cys-tRNA(Pro) deacylase)